jgi:phosphonate transport system ATP-binding protein
MVTPALPDRPQRHPPCDEPAPAGASAPSDLTSGAIQLQKLHVHRGRQRVLHELSLTLEASRITVIVGPSGVGKSTLMGVLNGLLRPCSGSVSIGDLGSLAEPAVLREHRRRTATVFQEHALIDRLSSLDNVLLGLADTRHPLSPWPWPKALRERAAQALLDVGLLHRAHARTDALSGGERQRVGIARALVRRPTLILGDEPFSAVDPALTRQLGDQLRALVSASGITVVLVLHQIEVARRLADRIVGIAAGQVAFDGPPETFDLTAQARLFPIHSASTPLPPLPSQPPES